MEIDPPQSAVDFVPAPVIVEQSVPDGIPAHMPLPVLNVKLALPTTDIPEQPAIPEAKRAKMEEIPNGNALHVTAPVAMPSVTPPLSASPSEPKPKETEKKKRGAPRSKKVTDPNAAPGAAATKFKSETSAANDNAPLRASNNSALAELGLSWQEPKYEPHPSLHPMPVTLAAANSSKRPNLCNNLAVNGRGYNLVRANYPAQRGSWYFEVLVTDGPTLLSKIRGYQDAKANEDASTAPPSSHPTPPPQPLPESAMDVSAPAAEAPVPAPPRSDTPMFVPAEPASDTIPTETATADIPQEKKSPVEILDVSPYVSLVSSLSDMSEIGDGSKRPLPEPHWRLGWATELADAECPAGFDAHGFSWRDSGTLFHCARDLHLLVAKNAIATEKLVSNPRLERADDTIKQLDSYAAGDVLGFGIELPEGNMQHIKARHEHQEAELSRQSKQVELRRELQMQQMSMGFQPNGADLSTFKTRIKEIQAQLNVIPPIPPLVLPPTLTGSRLTFWKNGLLQQIAIADLPPGSYYPAVSMYYQGAVVLNFGPDFKHPPPPGFRPASELPSDYQIPLPASKFFPKLPTP